MKVVIKKQVHDTLKEPVVVFLSDEDKNNISNMSESAHFYCGYPDDIPYDEALDTIESARQAINKYNKGDNENI